MDIESRLRALGLVLPTPPQALGEYRASMRSGSLLFLSGQLPLSNGELMHSGRLGELTEEHGREAARLCALNVLAQIHAALEGWERLDTLVRVEGHIASVPGWTGHARVLDAASELFGAVLGPRGQHVRSAFGHVSLPMNAAVELVVTAAVNPA